MKRAELRPAGRLGDSHCPLEMPRNSQNANGRASTMCCSSPQIPNEAPCSRRVTSKREMGDGAMRQFFLEQADAHISNCGAEIYCVICGNLPAQVPGPQAFVSSRDKEQPALMHVCCLNDMTNLVFTHVIRAPAFAQTAEGVPVTIRVLNSAASRGNLQVKYPRIIRTRWIYLVDVLGFMMSHLSNVQTTP